MIALLATFSQLALGVAVKTGHRSTSAWHVTPPRYSLCDFGTQPSKDQCQAAVQQIANTAQGLKTTFHIGFNVSVHDFIFVENQAYAETVSNGSFVQSSVIPGCSALMGVTGGIGGVFLHVVPVFSTLNFEVNVENTGHDKSMRVCSGAPDFTYAQDSNTACGTNVAGVADENTCQQICTDQHLYGTPDYCHGYTWTSTSACYLCLGQGSTGQGTAGQVTKMKQEPGCYVFANCSKWASVKWRRDFWGERNAKAGTSPSACAARKAAIDSWCGITNTQMQYVPSIVCGTASGQCAGPGRCSISTCTPCGDCA
eukprot:TRINITY_DN15101_c0_g4_i1.p1 TRINITY_DN15101_c0_g4~~TRINITY_DN15101_c0_g4_i1.p1  ORF type:complete len:312 (-),score=8.30 TRINITY_DN15101_c0_g4_i1:341-1276(-)